MLLLIARSVSVCDSWATERPPMNVFHVFRAVTALVIFVALLTNGGTASSATFTQLEPVGNPLDPHYPVNGFYAANGINDEGLIVGGNNFTGILWSGGAMLGYRAVDGDR